MPDKKLTPMMELFNEIDKYVQFTSKYKEKFIEKERQMVIDAAVFMATPIIGEVDEEYKKNIITVAEQYYTKTYGKI